MFVRVVLFSGMLGLAAPVAVADEQGFFLTASGARVETPDLATLDCAGMGTVLMKISASRYRGPDPVPEGHPDRPLFEYENQLAATHYLSCQVGQNYFDETSNAFSQGFD